MSLAFFSYFLLWYGFQGTYIVKLRSVNFHMQSGNIGKQCIKRKTISNYSNRNTLIWPLSQDGEYSVKPAYRMLVSEFYNCLPNCSSAETSNKLWNKIWKVQVPNKIRHFKWSAAKESPDQAKLIQTEYPQGKSMQLLWGTLRRLLTCLMAMSPGSISLAVRN